jgi:excisionase family DNA binding protein
MKARDHASREVPPNIVVNDNVRPGVRPMYLSLRALGVYSGLSNRTLREYLHDRVHPLSFYKVGGKIVVNRKEFNQWMTQFRRVTAAVDVGAIVDDVMRSLR